MAATCAVTWAALVRAPGPAILCANVNGRIRWNPRETENIVKLPMVIAAEKYIVVDQRKAFRGYLAGKRDGR